MCPSAGPAQQCVSDITWGTGEWRGWGGVHAHLYLCWGGHIQLLSPLPPQLTVALHNVPDLSAGESCAFEEVTESEAILLPSGELRCPSPSLQELQALTQGHGQWAGAARVRGTLPLARSRPPLGLLQGLPALCSCSCSPRRLV